MRSSRVAFGSFFILHATNNKAHEEPARTRPGRVFALRSFPPRAAPRRHDHPRSGLAVTMTCTRVCLSARHSTTIHLSILGGIGPTLCPSAVIGSLCEALPGPRAST
ncbi:hypothetical protein NDU88_002466 [Pleurodeles waltl]|uniref:Uncharacterized protein n=1 Tax=Pleurodeles waltl TaxID=8319 RepID=A0AAV7KTN2_PLEWA|nr:hypothetical protein NDU88_002466 [Pleurodeles waltl]